MGTWGLVVIWAVVTLGRATCGTVRQGPELRESEVRRGGELGCPLEEVGSEREGVLLGQGIASVRMQPEAEGKGLLGAEHVLGAHTELAGGHLFVSERLLMHQVLPANGSYSARPNH